ncbi:MAG TPA: RNA 2'-phosphotransferase, partial [bacterium]
SGRPPRKMPNDSNFPATVCARYGHSVPIATPGKAVVPPEWLYHSTAPGALDALRQQGLQPQGRQFVHLSVTRQDALTIG